MFLDILIRYKYARIRDGAGMRPVQPSLKEAWNGFYPAVFRDSFSTGNRLKRLKHTFVLKNRVLATGESGFGFMN